jgi:hypothetical protein
MTVAVRSSAAAEDLPTASFAGQRLPVQRHAAAEATHPLVPELLVDSRQGLRPRSEDLVVAPLSLNTGVDERPLPVQRRDRVAIVDMDALSERALNNCLYARAMMGMEVSWPDVRPSTTH